MLSKLPVGVRVENYLRIGSKVHQNIKQGLYLKSANLFFTDFIIVAVRPQVEVSGHTTLEEFVNATITRKLEIRPCSQVTSHRSFWTRA